MRCKPAGTVWMRECALRPLSALLRSRRLPCSLCALAWMRDVARKDAQADGLPHVPVAVLSVGDGTPMSARRTGCPPAAPTP